MRQAGWGGQQKETIDKSVISTLLSNYNNYMPSSTQRLQPAPSMLEGENGFN